MSTTGTDTDLPTDSTPEYHADFSYGEEAQVEEEEELFLNSEDFISGPYLSEKCTVPYDILEMDYSYGYNCKKLFNLACPDEDTIVFIGGNLIHFMDVKTRDLTFRRSYLGGGIGHITVNPNSEYPHLTVAENGDNPPIIIYEWPSMDIVGILKDGASKRYSHINYSPDGEMLVSQSYAPDFLITVWNWKNWRRSGIVLRIKSHVTDVFRCMFSRYVPGQITTGGAGHIKFWKMAETFTGLKLQGELGRFGKTEISDIVGVYPMPDEKVISGSEWGNLLVWEAGLIKVEVLRTLRRRCHEGPVFQLEYIRSKGEIWTISQDGWMRAWEYRIIDEADPPDEDRVVQMVPSYERELKGAAFTSMCKKRIYDPDDTFYYAQDSNGGIWQIDLVLSSNFESPVRLKSSHAGSVVDMVPCPWGPFLVSIGESGKLCVFNYETRKQKLTYTFNASGRQLIWLPLSIDPTGSFFIGGFDDGVIRVFNINFHHKYELKIVESVKPHNKPITVITINKEGSLLVTGGEDGCIFIFQLYRRVNEIALNPIGFVPLAAVPSCFTWHPTRETILLVGCSHGELFEFDLPLYPVPYTKISYLLHTIKPAKQRFTSCKAQIRRDIHIAEIEARQAAKIERKMQEIAKIKADGLDVDEDAYLQDSEEAEVLEPLHIPEVPNPIYFTQYTNEDTIWLSMGGYDAGYIYECHMDQKSPEPLKSTIIADGDDIEMYGYIYSPDGNYIITSMQYGCIRINRINPKDFRDLSDYWQLSMHDNFEGRITKMAFSYDCKYFFSAGEDGNLFSYFYKSDGIIKIPKPRKLSQLPLLKQVAVDESYNSLCLEEMMIKAEEDKQMRLANEHKRVLRNRLKELTAKLTSLLDRNCKLPQSQRYPLRTFIVDDRIMEALNSRLEAKVVLERRKLAYDVEKSTIALDKLNKHYTDVLDMYPFTVKAMSTADQVDVIVIRGLRAKFFNMFDVVEDMAKNEGAKGRLPERKEVTRSNTLKSISKVQDLEPFLVGLSPSTIAFKLGSKLTRLLNKYRTRKQKKEQRQEEWAQLYSEKPVEGVNHPEDVKAVKGASKTIGDFKLKTSPNYKVPKDQRDSTIKKYKQLLDARLRACKSLVSRYNERVYRLRWKKERIINQLKTLKMRLDMIHKEIPQYRIIQPPPIPSMTDADYPENEMEVKLTVESDFSSYLEKQRPRKHIAREDPTCPYIDWEKEALGIEILPDTPGTPRDIIMFMANQTDRRFDPFNRKIPVKDDFKECFLETEIKHRRLVKKIHEQTSIIEKMNTMITDFNVEVKVLFRERFKVIVDASFLELHILVLNQELIIVKEFEGFEHQLSDVAVEKWTEMMDQRDSMKRIELEIERHNYNIEGFQEQIKILQNTFLTAAKDNKFWDFLRRIFKKKYRPPKVATDDDDSSSFSSESSTDSEDDDAGSLDSRDIGPIRLDESVCPKGCDIEIYDYTFNLRGRRHELEKQIGEERKFIDNCKKELDQASKRVKFCEQASRKASDELEEYIALKQRSLNEVKCVVMLRLSQLRHLNPDGYSVAKLSDTLIFGVKRLNELYKRVGELQLETLEERTRHKKNRLHLHRMNMDCQFMEKTIANLRKEITEKMIMKFGSRVKIDEIEESILRRMILNLRISMLNLGAIYEKEIDRLRNVYGEKQVELKTTIQENTARLEILALLNKEKVQLVRLLENQAKVKAKSTAAGGSELYYSKDIDKLKSVVKSQEEQIQLLKSEIKVLSTKSLPPKPISHDVPVKLKEYDEEPELQGDYGSLDDLYEPPDFSNLAQKIVTVMPTTHDERVTEEEIVICVHELMKEVVDSALITEETEEEMIVQILSEIIEQIPMDYLQKKKSVEFFTDLIKHIVTDALKENSETIARRVSRATSRSVEEISRLVENIFTQVVEGVEGSVKEENNVHGDVSESSNAESDADVE